MQQDKAVHLQTQVGVCGCCTCIEAFKRCIKKELDWTTNKRLKVIGSISHTIMKTSLISYSGYSLQMNDLNVKGMCKYKR